MNKNRLEAFSDGVLAIIITIMVLEMSVPDGSSLKSLVTVFPTFIGYVISYTYIGIYWVNHHRLLIAVEEVSGRALWTNLLWMFLVSLVPFATAWASNTGYARIPSVLYGIVLFVSAIAYHVLAASINRSNGGSCSASQMIIRKRRSLITVVGYGAGIPLAYIHPIAAFIVYIAISVLWILPDVENRTCK